MVITSNLQIIINSNSNSNDSNNFLLQDFYTLQMGLKSFPHKLIQ